eukprot:CAMPEP_0114329220 /NCGR_PEP_ID=MMETSP0101-20121206/933_1 /TAXON_ID=38822 ORGANISM="Pteridomonas danica, Strain PT" /NCGR_SAMPLE_ID=MMETSP0101 /ASSEMBLY_ACC=CAM_ASM_000211 /LENGTH=367 /DNA_ID=CAMNT_0001458813 /DNA_START=66 /DNA_END=1168 /DNA_ORIENTATION=-
MFLRVKSLSPGIISAASIASLGFMGADHLGAMLLSAQGLGVDVNSPISGIPVSILLGIAAGNYVIPGTFMSRLKPGISYCSTTILRAGIVCVGLKLSILDVANFGLTGIPVVMASMLAGLTFIPWVSSKVGLSPKLGSLLACGTSICGVTAITAAEPSIKADSKDTATAIANVVAFGTIGMLTYPYFAHAILSSSQDVGMFLGTSIHDTSQVLGSAVTYKQIYGDEMVLKVAAITKLTRNLCLVGVMPALGWKYREEKDDHKSQSSFQQFRKLVPGFVLGFLGASVFRSTGDYCLSSGMLAYGVLPAEDFKFLTSYFGSTLSNYALGIAMAGVGLGTNIKSLAGVGYKPFLVGFSGCMVVGATSFRV